MRRFGVVGLALAAALVLAVPAARPDSGDAWLTTKIKIALLTADGVSASAVNVDSQEGSVTIHGKVKTAEEKTKAEAVTRQVDGVKDVKNLLQVVPEAEKEIVKATDDSISNGVEAALQADKALDSVKVASVNKGVVLLKGKTPDLNAKLKAIELTLATPGVKRVASEIETAPQK
ncbi:MAG TPA: BON domain-containing protein [Vicinamibacteria bacterium]|jgi:hyperosmotically inducible protein